MASKLNGRVFAGEDSEEEDEEEEGIAYSFQFSVSSSASQASARVTTPAPRFSVQAPVVVAPPAATGGEEGDESDESDDDTAVSLQPIKTLSVVSPAAPAPAAVNGEDSEDDDSNANAAATGESARLAVSALQIETTSSASTKSPRLATPPPVKKKTPTAAAAAARPSAHPVHTPATIEANDTHWQLDAASTGDGVSVMGDAIVSRLQPSLDNSIHRIAELTESQQHLLELLVAQNASVCANEQIKRVAVVMDKLPHYVRKVQDLKAAMNEISASVEKMKKRAESLRVDAQSHAIKKENKRDSMSQWNKMVAASANGASTSRE